MDTVYQDREITKYVSFKEIDVDVKLGILYSNNISNSKGKLEILEDLDVNQMIEKEGEQFWVREFLLDIKVNRKPLFVTTEQGVGKYSKDFIIIPNPA